MEVRRFEDLIDAASDSLLESGGFSTQNSVKASWLLLLERRRASGTLLFDRRRASGMVSVVGYDVVGKVLLRKRV